MSCQLSARGLVVLLCLGMLLSASPLGQKTPVRIGVVLDGPSERNQALLSTFQEETTRVLEDEHQVLFPSDKTLVGDWTYSRVASLLDRLIFDDQVDIVVALGVVGSQAVIQRRDLPRPVFAGYVIDPEVQNAPFEEVRQETGRPGEVERYRVSGVKNLNYLMGGTQAAEETASFQEIVPFTRLTVLTMEALAQGTEGLDQIIRLKLAPLSLEKLDVVLVGSSVSEALSQIPQDTEAVTVVPLLHLGEAAFGELAAGLNDRRLPTLSIWGRDEVERGLLATFHSGDDLVRRSRRLALNIQETLEGRDPGEMTCEYRQDVRLVLNMETARRIGVSPRYTVLLEAELLNDSAVQPVRNLSLGAVVREASTVNLDLAAADRAVSASEEAIGEAGGALWPQIDLSGGVNFADGDRARTLPTLAGTQWYGALQGSQLIYSDSAWANYSIAKSGRDLRMEERAQLRLDVVQEAAGAYLRMLQAQTAERIQKDNLKVTRSNLELAAARVEIGVAGREELFRWESQIATNQQEVILAQARRNQARIAVNRILNRQLNEVFGTLEASLSDPELVASFESLGHFIDNPRGFSLFSEFMTNEALAAAPELRQFDAAIRAKQRELQSAQRSFFIPDFGLVGGISAHENKGEGSEPIPGLNNTDWYVGISATLPLFRGGERWARTARVKLEVEDLTLQKQASSQRVEERIRSLLQAANASYIAIQLSQAQLQAARQNLQLVTDSYAAGVVEILTLLDAQNEALVAELAAANAVYTHLSDLMAVQRAVGHFDYFRSPEERQDFLDRLNQYYRDQGVTVRYP